LEPLLDDSNPRLRIALVAVGGLIIVIVVTLIIILFTAGDGQNAAITNITPSSAPTTTAPATTTEATTSKDAPPSTTTTETTKDKDAPPNTTTTLVATTTTEGPADPSEFDTDIKTAESTGDPGSALTGVRTGDHTTFARVVFDFEGDGTPMYEVGYESGPTFTGSGGGDPVAPDGAAFLVVRIVPGLTYDVDDFSPTYLGPTSFDPELGSIVEIVFVDDFEADMYWVIGLTGERGFQVSTRLDPQRLVIDIAN
jgi:hypothetical protein